MMRQRGTANGGIRENIKNNKGAYFVGTLAVAAAVLMLVGRDGKPVPDDIIRGDGICHQVESYPYERGKDGKVVESGDGKPIPNPFYSKEDCHSGDSVCDDDPEKLKNAAGDEMDKGSLRKKFTDGQEISQPLESADPSSENFSPDCARARCGPKDENEEIKGKMFSGKARLRHMRQRTQKEVEEMHSDSKGLAPGDNYFVTQSEYEESCNPKLDPCSSTSEGPCNCANHEKCKPKPPKSCGNKKLEPRKGEQCELNWSLARVKRICQRKIRRLTDTLKYYVCEACKCVVRRRADPDPRPPTGNLCPPDVKAKILASSTGQALKRTVKEAVRGKGGKLRDAFNPGPKQKLVINVDVDVDAIGRVSRPRASARCGKGKCSGSADIMSITRLSDQVGRPTVGAPGINCKLRIPVSIPSN
jgi:hypothetical protein